MPYVVSSQSESSTNVDEETRQITTEDFVSEAVLPPDIENHPAHASVAAVKPKGRMGSTKDLNYYSVFEIFGHGGLPGVLNIVECSPGLCLPGPELI